MPVSETLITAIQTAVIDTLLRPDEELAELLGTVAGREKIVDEPYVDKEEELFPYVYLAAVNKRRAEFDEFPIWEVRMRFFCVTGDFGRVTAWNIVERMEQILDLAEPELAAPYRLQEAITVVQSGDSTDPQGPKAVFVDLKMIAR